MTIARGRPNKQLRLIRVSSEKDLEGDEQIWAINEAGDRKKCGQLTSVSPALLNGARYCLGFCKSSVEPGTALLISDAQATIVDIPAAND
jgi:hypothetical protein